MIKQLSLQRLAIVQLIFCLLLVISNGLWCSYFPMFGTDLCWLVGSSYEDLQRAFPNQYRLVFLVVWMWKFGIITCSVLFALFTLVGKQLLQNLLLLLVSISITLLLSEFTLRRLNFEPGQFHYSPWIHPVDSLFIMDGFVTDSNGIIKVDTSLTNAIIEHPEEYGPNAHSGEWSYWSEIARVMADYGIVAPESQSQNSFWQHKTDLLSLPSGQHSKRDSIFLNFIDYPFNEDGFFSISFSAADKLKQKVLLLGDSFAWGHSTQDKTSSFANELLARGFNVFNTGISGADVSQYLAVLKKFGPLIQPDIVVCNFYLGNDIQYFERVPRQKVPLAFHTNAGVIYTHHHGEEFTTAQAAYDNIMSNMVIPQTAMVNRMMSKTVVSTYAWLFCAKLGIVEHTFFKGKLYPDEPITQKQMMEMTALCSELGAEFILSAIPTLEEGELKGAEKWPGLFGAVPFYQPEMTVDMYNGKDGHFNSTGHLHYAMYLEKLILETDPN